MRNYSIITDTCCDIPLELAQELKIIACPMNLAVGDKQYKDWLDKRELSNEEYFRQLRSGIVGTTSAVSIGDIQDAMIQELEKGNDVLYLSFSSGMSTSYQSATIAMNKIAEDYPNNKIVVVDTLCGCVGEAVAVYHACKQRDQGKSLEEVVDYINELKMNIQHVFMLEDLKHIQKTGRISKLTSIVAGILNIRPIMNIDKNGEVMSAGKIRGRKAAIQHLADRAINECTNSDVFFIANVDCSKDAETLKNLVQAKFPNAHIVVGYTGVVMSNNTGPDALAIGFVGQPR